jgi:hypothetical protein
MLQIINFKGLNLLEFNTHHTTSHPPHNNKEKKFQSRAQVHGLPKARVPEPSFFFFPFFIDFFFQFDVSQLNIY